MRETNKYDEIISEIDEWVNDEEKLKTLTQADFESMVDKWTADFKVEQPSQFFKDHPTNDSELVCSTQNGKDFLLYTLRFFGLPKGYLHGEGHFADWSKKRLDEKKKGPKTKKDKKKQGKNIMRLKK